MSRLRVLVTVLALFCSAVPLSASVLTFDDVPGANPATSGNVIPNGYGGFNWDQASVLHKSFHPGTGYEYGVVSGEWAAYSAYDNLVTVADGTFDFNGVYLTSAWNQTDNINIEGWLGSTRLYDADVQVVQRRTHSGAIEYAGYRQVVNVE